MEKKEKVFADGFMYEPQSAKNVTTNVKPAEELPF